MATTHSVSERLRACENDSYRSLVLSYRYRISRFFRYLLDSPQDGFPCFERSCPLWQRGNVATPQPNETQNKEIPNDDDECA